MSQAGTVWVDVRGDLSGFLKDVTQGAGAASKSLGGLVSTGAKTVISDIESAAGATALGLGALGVAAVKVSSDFNAAVSGVSAVSGASADELDRLREAALEAGAATAFSASEAAVAEQELVKAGVSVSDTLGGALTGALSLAAAGQLDLGQSAEIAAQAMNIFGLAGSEVERVADVLAAGANKSAADVGQLGEALRQGGLLAQQTGLDLEETTGVLSLFADNALIGSDAGTSLKTMLQRLNPQSKEAKQLMEELGLAFYDSEGAFVGIESVAQQLQDSLGGLSEEQRATALNTIFGSDAVRGATLLMDAGADGVHEYTEAVSEQGIAARTAAEQLDNLKGDVEEFSGSVETALIRVGDLAEPSLRGLLSGGTDLVNVFNDFATTPAWAAIQDNVDRLSAVGGDRIRGIADSLAAVLSGIDASDVNKTFDTIVDGAATAREAVAGLEPVLAGLGLSLTTLSLRAVPFLGALVPTLSPLTGILGGIVAGSDEAQDALVRLGGRAVDLGASVGPDLLNALSDLVDMLGGGIAVVLDEVGGAAIEAGELLGPVLADGIRELAPVIGELIESGAELAGDVLPLIAGAAADLAPLVVDVLATGLGIAADATGVLTDNMWLLAPALGALVAVKFGDTIAGWGSALGGVASSLGSSARDFSTYFQVLRTEGASVGGALSGAAKETGGLSAGLIGLNPAVVGVTAAATVGVIAYQKYAENKRRVTEATDRLTEALRAEEGSFDDLEAANARKVFKDKDALDAQQKLGISLGELTDLSVEQTEAVRQLDDEWVEAFLDAEGSIDKFREIIADAPPEIRALQEEMFRLVDSGALDIQEAHRFFQALDELAQASTETMAGNRLEFESLAREAAAAGDISATQLRGVLDAIANAETPEELAASFQLLQGYLGDTASTAADAADEVRALIDALDELGMVRRNVDELERGLLDARDRTAELFAEGTGIDRNTAEGRDRLDALQQEIEATERYAEELAKLDPTGQQAALALHAQRLALEELAAQGKITGDELEYLLDLYGLTPESIETKVLADIADAEAGVAEITERLNKIPGGPDTDPVKAKVQALIDQGKYLEAAAALAALERTLRPKIEPQITNFPAPHVLAGTIFDRSDGVLFGGGRAGGGGITPGMAFLVGEEGPEIIFPDEPGFVIPAKDTKSLLDGATVNPGGSRTQIPYGAFGAPSVDNSDLLGAIAAQAAAIEAQTARLEAALANAGGDVKLQLNQRNYGVDGDRTARRTMDAAKALVASL
jgi:TP901 family phage tail tape measure protein